MKYTLFVLALLFTSTCFADRHDDLVAVKKERKALAVQLKREREYLRANERRIQADTAMMNMGLMAPFYYNKAQKRQAAMDYPWSRAEGILYHDRVMRERSSAR